MAASKKEITEAYRKHYRRTGDWSDAWNATLDEYAGTAQERVAGAPWRDVADILQKVHSKVLLEEGDPLETTIHETAKALKRDKVLKTLDKEWKEAAKGLSESEREEMEYPVLYLEFDAGGEFDGWTIDHPQFYRGHAGPLVAIYPGQDLEDVKREIGNTLAESGAYENNPREENPNRDDVMRAWQQGRKLKASALRTEDGKLWSYALLIGETIDGKLVAYDYTGSNRVSPTTTTHVNAAKRVADEVRSAEGRPGRYAANPRKPNPASSTVDLVRKLKF